MTKRKVIFNLILLSLITSVFLVFGALVFSKIEGKQRGINPEESTKSLRESISKKYNISDKEFLELHRSFKTLIEAEDDWLKSDWTFYEALYFAGSVITTVGKFLLFEKCEKMVVHVGDAKVACYNHLTNHCEWRTRLQGRIASVGLNFGPEVHQSVIFSVQCNVY